MATKRIKDLTNTAASVASDAYLAIDGTSNGTEKITRDNFRQDTADAFVAAPGTYNLAPLSGGAVEVAKGGTGSTTAAGARTNLEVNSIDEDAQANALKSTAPALYFDGSASVITVADDDKFSFTDGVDDLPFTVSAWVKMEDASSFGIVTKYVNSGQYEWAFWVDGSDKLVFRLTENTDIGDYSQIKSDATVTAYEGQWIHVAASYAGAGPTAASGNDFSAAASGMALYINGSAIAATGSNVDYPGMTAGSDPVIIGKILGSFSEGSIRDVKIFNRELTATEV
ncbi:MAG: LamG domain-containing protein, partial [bacterium]